MASEDRMCFREAECVYILERECVCVSETHTECFRAINGAPDRLQTCFRHQIASKQCDQFTDLVRIVQNCSELV